MIVKEQEVSKRSFLLQKIENVRVIFEKREGDYPSPTTLLGRK